MRVLILSCNTGEGHNSCGKALSEMFAKQNIPCRMDDAFRFLSPSISRMVTVGFNFMYRHLPGAFRFGYQYSEQHPRLFEGNSLVYRFLSSGSENLYHFILREGFDTVICTHVFSALIVTDVMSRHNRFLRTYFVATDYTCSPSCAQSDLDAYFIPDAALTGEFIRCGISSEKLIPTGIPIREDFLHANNKEETKVRFGLHPYAPHLLIMGGSMGCGPMKYLVRQISKAMPKDCAVTVICGTNRKLRAQLERDYAEDHRVVIRGFVEDVPAMMDSADLFLTKPGGISVTEAAQKRLPMVFANAVAGCENYNMRFFVRKGVAVTAETPKELACLTATILADQRLLSNMVENYQRVAANTAAQAIAQEVICRSGRQGERMDAL